MKGRRLALLSSAPPEAPPCGECSALCCRYFALQIDTPESEEDLDAIRWYVMHESTWVWVDDGDWYLQVDRVCRNLGPDRRCGIYETRPSICREYGLSEEREAPEDPLCDFLAAGASHDMEFRTPQEVERYGRVLLDARRAERRRRSEAARRGWATRRAREKGKPRVA